MSKNTANNGTNNKRVWQKIAIAAVGVMLILLVVISIPDKYDKIEGFLESGQYSEAISYVEKKNLKFDETEEKAGVIKNELILDCVKLNEKILDGEIWPEEGEKFIKLSKLLYSDIGECDEIKELETSIGIVKDIKAISDQMEESYIDALDKAVDSDYLENENYREMLKAKLEVTGNDYLAEKLSFEIDKRTESHGFVSIPKFLKSDSDVLAEYLSDELVEDFLSEIDLSNKSKMCTVSGCSAIKSSPEGKYCTVHKCDKYSCENYASDGYCSTHKCNASGCKKEKNSSGNYCSTHTCSISECNKYAEGSYCGSHTCNSSGCKNGKLSGGNYCNSHTCAEIGCYGYTKDDFCQMHTCKASGCKGGRLSGGSYCITHTCSEVGCKRYASGLYCSSHKVTNNYSSSSGSCYLCGGSGMVKYYYGNGDYDYEYGVCGSCHGTGRKR